MIEWTAARSAGGDNGRRFHPRLFAEGVCEDGHRDESGGQADEMHQPRRPPPPTKPHHRLEIKDAPLAPQYQSRFGSVRRINNSRMRLSVPVWK